MADLALVVRVGDLVDDDGQGVGQLVAHALQGGLAHELGDHDLLGLVGDLTGGVQRRRQGHVLEKDLLKDVDLLVALGRDRNDVGPLPQLTDGQELGGQGFSGDGVGLGDHGDHRGAQLGEVTGDEAVAGADLLVGGDAEDDDVDVDEGLAHQVVEALAQQGAGAVEAGGVDQDDLRVLLVDDAAHVVASGLGAPGGDGDLGADHGVGEGGLAGVGAAHDAGEAGAEVLGEVGDDDLDTGRVTSVGCVGALVRVVPVQDREAVRIQPNGGIGVIGTVSAVGVVILVVGVGERVGAVHELGVGGEAEAGRGGAGRGHLEGLGQQILGGLGLVVAGCGGGLIGGVSHRCPLRVRECARRE